MMRTVPAISVERARAVASAVRHIQPVANAGGQFVGSGGGLHAMHAALEQRAADGGLQPGDMLRHGRLRQIKAARGPLIERWR
jgi:hypothetical protein